MRTARKIRYRLEWLGLKSATKFLPLLSRKACYRLALLLGSLGAMLDRRGRRVALSNLRVAFGDEISSVKHADDRLKREKMLIEPAKEWHFYRL
jgi:lauroyl/myristoyl acyltransferase